MFQPFIEFKPEFIDRLIEVNKKYIVSQTYKRAFNHFAETHKTDILFSDYDDIGLAKIHCDALKNDKYAALIYLTEPKHREKVNSMLSVDSQYRVYWSVVQNAGDVKKRIDLKYKDNIRRYIQKNTTWRIGMDESIKPIMQVIYGELFLVLKRGNQTLRIKFDEIERV